MKRVNQQFFKENGVRRNGSVNSTNRIVHEICNDSCCKVSYSHDLSSDNLHKSLESEEYVPTYQCDKPSGYVFVDVGSNLIESVNLLEEDGDICKVSSESVFTDNKDIDYNLIKHVTIEKLLKNSSKENEMHNNNLETTVLNISDICTGNDRSSLSTNAHMANTCEHLDDYNKKPIIDVHYTTTSTVSASGDFEKVNTYQYVKEEKSIEDVLTYQSTKNMSLEIKKEEMVYNEEVSILNESIIDIKLHSAPVNKVKEPLDVSTNYSCVLDETIKTEFVDLNESINSDFQEVHSECSEEVPDNFDIGNVMVLQPLEENQTVQSKRESHLKLQNKVQTLNTTRSELQIKPQSNSGDDTGAAGEEDCINKLNEDDVNTQTTIKNDAVCQYHRKRKSKNKTDRHHVCKVCDKDFTQLCDLEAHKWSHIGDGPFGCDACGKAFKQWGLFENHKCIHNGDKPFGCDTCGKTFTQMGHLKYHKCVHKCGMPYGCDTCGNAFRDMDQLKDHKSVHTGDRLFCCDKCGKIVTHRNNLKKHIHIHNGDKRYGCDTCGKAFIQQSEHEVHKCFHTSDRPFGCDTCGKTFILMSYLKLHKRIHTGDKPFGCDTCGKTFTQNDHLKRHKLIHTGDKPFGCDTCDKAFRRLDHLESHKRIHTGDRPFGCDTCGKTFTHKCYLNIHIRIHTGEMPFKCNTCGKAYTRVTSLKRHEHIHTGDRPFGCDKCGKAFRRLDHLENHKRLHTGDRPFGCDTCGKAFSQLVTLKKHKCVHTGDGPFFCDTCGKTFTKKFNLRAHIRIHIGDRP